LREMDRDKQSSKHTFGAWSDPTNKFVDGWMASHRSVMLVQLPDDSSLAGNGNSNCSSRFSSSSSLLVLALRLTAVSGASLAQLSYAAHTATPAVRPSLSFRTLLLAGIVHFGALSNKSAVAKTKTVVHETFEMCYDMRTKLPPSFYIEILSHEMADWRRKTGQGRALAVSEPRTRVRVHIIRLLC